MTDPTENFEIQPMDLEKRVRQYIALRDALKAMDDAHKANRKGMADLIEELTGKLQHFMTTHNMESLRTSTGTCYKSTRHTASLADPEAFMKYVIDNKMYDLLDRRANSTAVKEYVEKNHHLPPGCNLTAMETLGVRRKAGE
jgi:hypothetical protein